MSIAGFLDSFDQLVDQPDMVEKIRELVLSLAIQGRLVEQLAADGTADTVLQEISHNHTATSLPIVAGYTPEAPPLQSIPRSWRWVPTSALCDLQAGKRMKGGAQAEGVISLGGEHLRRDGTVNYAIPRYISSQFYREMRSGSVALHDTLMVKDGATTGKTAFVSTLPSDGRAAVNEHVFILRWHRPIEARFAFYFIRAFATTHIASKSAGLIGGIRREAILDFPFPLPPLPEQKRIVQKVEELMGICDRLNVQLQKCGTQETVLARASLVRFNKAPTAANLNLLFHDSYGVSSSDLRKAIRGLTIQGKLVSQNPREEPARLLLDRIRATKKQLVGRGASTNVDKDVDQQPSSTPFDVPGTWKFAMLSEVCTSITDGDHLPPPKTEAGIPFLVIGNVRWGKIDFSETRHVSEDYFAKLDRTRKPQRGDVLYTLVGSLGIPVYVDVDREFCVQRHIGILRPSSEISGRFLAHVMASDFVLEQAVAIATGIAQKTVPLSGLRTIRIPVPPLEEQRRIVVKADEVMVLVNQLETRLAALNAIRHSVLKAVMAQLTVERMMSRQTLVAFERDAILEPDKWAVELRCAPTATGNR